MAKRAAKTATLNLRLAASERQLMEKAARRAHLWLDVELIRAS